MDRLVHPALQGMPVAWFAPNYKLAAPVWRELQSRLHPVAKDVSQQERRLELRGGGVLDVWSLDSADSGRGRAYASVVLELFHLFGCCSSSLTGWAIFDWRFGIIAWR
jgi:hypothetical protein